MELKYHKIAIILGLAYSRDPLLTNPSVFVGRYIGCIYVSIGVTYFSKEKQRLATHWVTATQKQYKEGCTLLAQP